MIIYLTVQEKKVGCRKSFLRRSEGSAEVPADRLPLRSLMSWLRLPNNITS